jgi:hypothetical protein
MEMLYLLGLEEMEEKVYQNLLLSLMSAKYLK